MVTTGAMIDLRSDPVKRPTRLTRRAVAEAAVADDNYGRVPPFIGLMVFAACASLSMIRSMGQ